MRRLMRSKLFVPGSRPDLFAKAAISDADALSLDLEDAVAPERKPEARAAVAGFLRQRQADLRQLVIVRVNGLASPWFADDVAAIAGPGLDVLNLPKAESRDDVRSAAEAMARAEAQAGLAAAVGILANIETPKGLRNAAEIASAHPRVMGLQIGYADLLEPCGIARSDPSALAHIRMAVRLAAGEAGIDAYDGAYPVVAEPDVLRRECEAARALGFAGKSCIHPSQIAIANEAFLPRPAEVERARRILAAAEEAERNGVGAYMVDGRMIDGPFLGSARAVVALADRHAIGASRESG